MATSLDLQDAVCAVSVRQMSDLESEVDYLPSSQAVSEAVALPNTVPVMGESFCECGREEELSPGFSVTSEDCLCGEEDQGERKLAKTVVQHVNTAGYTITWHVLCRRMQDLGSVRK